MDLAHEPTLRDGRNPKDLSTLINDTNDTNDQIDNNPTNQEQRISNYYVTNKQLSCSLHRNRWVLGVYVVGE